MDRALPGPMIDLIRDGVPAWDLRQRGGKAVYAALCRTAASAAQRGWDSWEWQALIEQPASRLGTQVRLRDAIRVRSGKAVAKLYDGAWDSATAWLHTQPLAFTRKEMAAHARKRAGLLMQLVADPDFTLTDPDRVVLAYACAQASERGMDRVALPRRTVARDTKLGERTVRNALLRLDDRGLLTLAEAGKPGTYKPRANLYRLGLLPVVPVPVNGSVGRLAEICGTPSDDELGTPTLAGQRSVGPPPLPLAAEQTQEGAHMVTLTLSAANAEELARALALIRRETAVDVRTEVEEPVGTSRANVTPLRPRRGTAS